MAAETIIVGAGVAGLSCARRLRESGCRPIVLDKAGDVGGRCATRRVGGQPVDHGVIFLHGSDPGFLESLREAVPHGRLDGWPARVHGSGAPCQPEAFAPRQRRCAFAQGLAAFPERLAEDLDVRLNRGVGALSAEGPVVALSLESGERLAAGCVVLALPLERSAALLDTLGPLEGSALAARRLMGMAASLPCLTVIAGYPLDVEMPEWDVCYPGDSPLLTLISHDSTKRAAREFHVIVCQASPRWSRERLEQPEEGWSAEILREAGRLLGPWALRPAWTRVHRWRHARVDRGSEFARPLLIPLPGGARIGIAGELFASGGGVEAAWISGRLLAGMIGSAGG